MSAEEQEERVAYCKKYNIHHLFELLATKVLVDRPENPFAYLRDMLQTIEESENKKGSYDPTQIHFAADDSKSDEGAGEALADGPAGGEEAAAPPPHHRGKEGGKRQKITLGTFGLNNAGKTTLLSALGGNVDVNCMPTVGFTPIQFSTEDYDICIFDLGGAANFRGIWVHYFHDCHGLIYVIDSASDEGCLAESLEVFKETAGHPYMRGKPVLVLANKKDLPTSRVHTGDDTGDDGNATPLVSEEMVTSVLAPDTPFREVATCGIREDPALDSGVEWLLATVSDSYEALASRVAQDTAHVKEEKERKRQERLAALREEGA